MLSIFSKSARAIKHGQKCAKSICDAVDDMDVIMQLILEDLEGASMGNDKARAFAKTSGVPADKYRGALENSRVEVDGPKGVKTFLDQVALGYYPDSELMAEFRLAATDYIMKHHRIGKYSK